MKNKLLLDQYRLIPRNALAKMLGMSTERLRILRQEDPQFPKPIKMGTNRQSSVFFDGVEVEKWIELKKKERDLAV